MSQPTLDRFFKVKKTCKDIYFIDWTKKPPMAQWLVDKPESVTYQTTVKWKEMNYVVQLCCFDDINDPYYEIPNELYYKNVSLFKSLLQKSVRRQLTELALQTSNHLLKMDLNALIRRLFVIMLEDTCLHPCVTTLVWLTSALSKGYQIRDSQVSWLFGFTKYLCEEKNKFYYGFQPCEKSNTRQLIKQIDQSQITPQQKDILYSILYRCSYGGMDGDVHMFYDYVFLWFEKFGRGETLSYIDFDNVPATTINNLQLTDILLNSADFHCFPRIIPEIQRKFPQLKDDEIKKCIWECSSKTNTRCINDIDPQVLKLWHTIETEVVLLQKKLIHII